jgi:hypothetical protein
MTKHHHTITDFVFMPSVVMMELELILRSWEKYLQMLFSLYKIMNTKSMFSEEKA